MQRSQPSAARISVAVNSPSTKPAPWRIVLVVQVAVVTVAVTVVAAAVDTVAVAVAVAAVVDTAAVVAAVVDTVAVVVAAVIAAATKTAGLVRITDNPLIQEISLSLKDPVDFSSGSFFVTPWNPFRQALSGALPFFGPPVKSRPLCAGSPPILFPGWNRR